MKRVIIDHRKLTSEILQLIRETYPYGYDDEDIIKFQNAKGEEISAIEVEGPDAIFLIKVSTSLAGRIGEFDFNVEDITEVSDENFEDS